MTELAWSTLNAEEVVARLEVLLPGLSARAERRDVERRSRRVGQMAQGHGDEHRSAARPLTQLVLGDVDGILEHAEHSNVVEQRLKLAEDFVGVQPSALATLVSSQMPSSSGDVFVVSDTLACYRVRATELHAFLLRGPSVTGECSFDGDELFIASATSQVVVVHHSGWVFVLRGP